MNGQSFNILFGVVTDLSASLDVLACPTQQGALLTPLQYKVL